MAQVKYTEEDVVKLITLYEELGNDGLDEIAKQFPGKTKNSVRAKLVKEGVYVAPEKPKAAKKNQGPTKKELIQALSKLTGSEHKGIDGATKEAISEIIELLTPEVVDTVVEVE